MFLFSLLVAVSCLRVASNITAFCFFLCVASLWLAGWLAGCVRRYGMKFYEGGFDDKMDRREAALILGVRTSADKKRVQKAYRRLLTLNHPDTGGSTFLSTKINEAKDIMLGGQ